MKRTKVVSGKPPSLHVTGVTLSNPLLQLASLDALRYGRQTHPPLTRRSPCVLLLHSEAPDTPSTPTTCSTTRRRWSLVRDSARDLTATPPCGIASSSANSAGCSFSRFSSPQSRDAPSSSASSPSSSPTLRRATSVTGKLCSAGSTTKGMSASAPLPGTTVEPSRGLEICRRSSDALLECLRVISETRESMVEAKECVCGAIRRMIGAQRCYLFEVDRSSGMMKLQTRDAHSNTVSSVTFQSSKGITGLVASSGVMVNVSDASSHANYDARVDDCKGAGDAMHMLAACAVQDEVPVAVITLLNDKTEGLNEVPQFSREDESLLRTVLPFVSASLHNSYSATLHRQLAGAQRVVSAELETQKLYHTVVTQAADLMDCEAAQLFLIDGRTSEHYLAASTTTAPPVEGAPSEVRPLQEKTHLAAHVTKTKTPLILRRDVAQCEHFNPKVDQPREVPVVRNVAAWPVCNSTNAMGVLELLNRRPGTGHAFNAVDQEVLGLFSAHVSEAIQNASVFTKTLAGYQAAMSTQLKYQALLEVAESLAVHLESAGLVAMILRRARELVHAERSSLFLIDAQTNELVSQVAEGEEGGIRCPLGSGIAGHVATTGEVLNIKDAYGDARFNQEVDKSTGYRTRNIICVPIRNAESGVIGVTEIINKQPPGASFTKEDEELLKAFSIFCGLALHNAELYDRALSQERRSEALLDVVMALTSDTNITPLLQTIMKRARELISADRASLFIVDPKSKELRTQMADGTQEIVVPSGPSSIAGFVATTGQDLAIEDAYRDPRFNPGIDKVTGYTTKSVLAIPILNQNGEVVAVTEMINKRDGGCFKDEDMALIKAFASFCGKSLTDLAVAYESTVRPVRHYPLVETTKASHEAVLGWDFDVNGLGSRDDLIIHVVAMFEELSLFEEFKLPLPRFVSFLHELARSYNTVPYHNFYHAVDVTQFVFLSLKTSDILRASLTRLDIFALMIAALCHDVDHGGFNNAFQVNAQTPLAMLFANMSIMESYHVSRSIAIMSNEACDLLSGLSQAEHSHVWSVIISCILATDMASHFSIVNEFESFVKSGQQVESVAHRKLLARILIKCGDISNVARPFPLAHKWADILLVEYFQQGEAERNRVLPLTPFMDKSRVVKAQMQLGFINTIALPMFNVLCSFATDLRRHTAMCLTANADRWSKMLAETTPVVAPQPQSPSPAGGSPASSAASPAAPAQPTVPMQQHVQHVVEGKRERLGSFSQVEAQLRQDHGDKTSQASSVGNGTPHQGFEHASPAPPKASSPLAKMASPSSS